MDTTFFLSLLGALAWVPTIIDFFKKPKLIGRILAFEAFNGTFNEEEKVMYFFEINMISLNKSINVLDLDIGLKHVGSRNIVKGEWYWFNNFEVFKFNKRFKLDIPVDSTIPFKGNINNTEMQKVYLTFTTDIHQELEESKLDELHLTFHDAKGKKRKINLKLNKIDEKQIMWDDKVWKEVK